MLLDSLGVCTAVVAASEIGDKTQLLALLLAARFRSRTAIVTGILFATILNHAMAGIFGTFVSQWLPPEVLRWALSIGFILMAGWMLIPDKADDNATECRAKLGAFGTTLLLFFLAEMGDKTQLATVALAAHFSDVLSVVAGTTLGMLIADVPAVYAGEWIVRHVPMKPMRIAACMIFIVLAVVAFLFPVS